MILLSDGADRISLTDLNRLPLSLENSCALGVVTMHYLDDLCLYATPTSSETRLEVRTKVADRFQHSDLGGSLDDAFKIWNAVRDCEAIS